MQLTELQVLRAHVIELPFLLSGVITGHLTVVLTVGL